MTSPPAAVEETVTKEEAKPALEDSPEFREAVARSQNAEDDLAVVQTGTQLWKVRSFSKWYYRKYFLDFEEGLLRYTPTHKHNFKYNCVSEPTSLDVADILDVRRGWKTDIFNKFGSKVVGEQKKIKRRTFSRQRRPGSSTSSSTTGVGSEPPQPEAEPEPARPLVDEASCFSIVYGDQRRTLDLVAGSPQVAAVWVRALKHILTVIRGLNQEKRFNLWLENQFYEADVDKSGTLHFDEVLRLLLQLNVKMSKKEALHIFNLADTNKHENPKEEPSLDAKEFAKFYQLLMKRPEAEEIYHRYTRSAREMTATELQHFLKKEQGLSETTLDDCRGLIDAFEQSELKSSGRISIHGFTHMLMSEQFQIFNPTHKTVYQDMSQPLSSYWVATSHNTYLLGKQVLDDSTIEGYVEALYRGCRCIELDCWDGPDGEPVVTHGYALTTKLVFREVLKDAILPHAFITSEFPLILSLENHCTSEQQKRLAFHITDIFGDLLYLDSVSPDMETLPSPEQLKRRIIIKGRKVAPPQSSESESEDDEEMDSLSIPRSNGSRRLSDSSSESDLSRPSSPSASATASLATPEHRAVTRKRSSQRSTPQSTPQRKAQPQPVDQQLQRVTDQNLSDLVNICQGVHFHGFDEPDAKCYEMVSIAESKAMKLMEKSGEAFVRFNTRRLSRIYPAGTRAGSTNFSPWHFWNAGSQLVALNYQGSGMPVFMNESKFRDNGGCGFVLKPDFMRLPDFDKFGYVPATTNVNHLQRLKDRRRLLEIKIISGQHLPKPEGEGLSDILDPYVKVKIIGHPVDARKKQTHVVNDNGFNPRWDCTFQFMVNLPELAFVHFIVKDETPRRNDPIVGVYALPFTSLTQGYHHVPLLDMKRHSLEPATLFIHTKITEVAF